MKEIEVKVLNIDVKAIERKLRSFGVKKIKSNELMKEMIFDYPDYRIKKGENLLRLRKIGHDNILTFKHSVEKQKFRVAEEYELKVDDGEKMKSIFFGLGLILTKTREKKRTTYKFGNVFFEIDRYPQIPTYLELEGPKVEINNWIKRLEIDPKRVTNMNVSEVIRFYGIEEDGLVFKH